MIFITTSSLFVYLTENVCLCWGYVLRKDLGFCLAQEVFSRPVPKQGLNFLGKCMVLWVASPFLQSLCSVQDCCICLQKFEVPDQLREVTCCHHFFHLRCIDECLKIKTLCPLCQSELGDLVLRRNDLLPPGHYMAGPYVQPSNSTSETF